MKVYSGFIITAFGCHVTVLFIYLFGNCRRFNVGDNTLVPSEVMPFAAAIFWVNQN
jgi:hypothetical protein